MLAWINFAAGWAPATAQPLPELGIPRPLAAGESHRFDIELDAGDFFHLAVEQDGVDLFLRLLDPGGRELRVADRPTGARDREDLVAVAATPGLYRLEITAFGEPSLNRADPIGRYVVLEKISRPASPDDRLHAAADADERRGQDLLDTGALAEARVILENTLETWRKLGLGHRTALTLSDLGHLHGLAENADLARTAYAAAAAEQRARGAWRPLALALLNAANQDLKASAPEDALARVEEALPLFELCADPACDAYAALALARRGTARSQLGQLQPALRDLADALERSRSTPRRDIEATVLSELTPVELELGQLDSALRHAQAAERLNQARGTPRELALARQKLAATAARLGRLDEAESTIREALRGLPPANARERALLLSSLAHVLRRRGDSSGARTAFESALELLRDQPDERTRAILLTGLGHLLGVSGAPEQGLARLDEAQRLFDQLDDPDGQAMSRARSAELLGALGHFSAARQRIVEALERVETMRGDMARGDLRLSFFGRHQDYHEIAIDILLRSHAQDPEAGHDLAALAVHDRRLALELVDRLTFGDSRSLADAELLEVEKQLEDHLRELVQAPWHQARSLQIATVLERLASVRGEIRLAAGRPQEGGPVAPSLDDNGGEELLVELLDPGTLLLAYYLGEEESLLWTASLDGPQSGRLRHAVHRLPARREIERLIRDFIADLGSPDSRSQERARRSGRQLAALLLGPVSAELSDQRLALLVDGELHSLPFAALPRPVATATADGADELLIEHHELVQIPSLRSLRELRRRTAGRPRPDRLAAVFADPVYNAEDPRLPRTATGSRDPLTDSGTVFERLAGTAVEARVIAELAGDRDLLEAMGFEASRNRFLSAPLADYRVVHLATHGLPDPRPELAGLVFSRFDAEGHPQDGLVRLFEITRLELAADLVVLSGCETNVGRNIRGEGMLGLAWGFLQAGAARVIASLWPVGDRATAALMSELYQGFLADGLSPTAALRRAQLKALRRPESSPHDWAGFLLRGDWRDARPSLDP